MEPHKRLYPGKFIVIDGADATGKQTQVELLIKYFVSLNLSIRVLDFPRYYDNFWGKMVGTYLRGKFGGLYENNPYLSTIPYILDQSDAHRSISYALRKGTFVISNRYVSSNIHQAAKLPFYERDEYHRWLEEAVYTHLHAVRPDLTIILHLNTDTSLELNKSRKDRPYLNGENEDIAEKDKPHQDETRQEYLRYASKMPHWHVVMCNNPGGSLKPPELIHKEIIGLLTSLKFFDHVVTKDQMNMLGK
jgi:dTMP kinase